MSIAEGSCLCGTVKYAVHAHPTRVTMCHCKFCQRATGGAYLVEPIFENTDFEILYGNTKIYEHVSEGSGKLVYVHFCERCGTKLFLRFERFPDVTGVYGGTFDDPNWFDKTSKDAKHIFLDVAQHGTIIPAGMNTFKEHATTADGTPIEPTIFQEHTAIMPH